MPCKPRTPRYKPWSSRQALASLPLTVMTPAQSTQSLLAQHLLFRSPVLQTSLYIGNLIPQPRASLPSIRCAGKDGAYSHTSAARALILRCMQVADAEAALKAGMAKVSELERRLAAAPEPVESPPQVPSMLLRMPCSMLAML